MSVHANIDQLIATSSDGALSAERMAQDEATERQFGTLFYLIRQTTGATRVLLQRDGQPRPVVPADLACIEAPLVHMGRRLGVLRAYAPRFESGAAHLLAGFAILAAEQQALWAEAHLDVLTKALTRRAFKTELGRAVAMAQRSGLPCSLIMFDLDHFKRINDTHGHAAGDAVLSGVSHVVQSELRPSDRLGRLGGEEFGVLLVAEASDAIEVAERLRAVIEGTTLREFPAIAFTSSFGVASMAEPEVDSVDSLMGLADARLYAAKQSGRNRVIGAGGLVPAALVVD